MSGTPHLPYLIVSLYSLRQHYDGKIVIYAYPETYDFFKEFADKDTILNFELREFEPSYRGKNGQFLMKIRMMQLQPENKSLIYLDADTMVTGPINKLFLRAEVDDGHKFVPTQFNNWISSNGHPRKRVSRLVDAKLVNQEAVQQCLSTKLPSPNGGVFACVPDAAKDVLDTWFDWTMSVKHIFIADETVLHVLIPHFNLAVATGGSWNCAPKFRPDYLREDDVTIWHFHGDSNVRQNKSPYGISLWYPNFERCIEINACGIKDWCEDVDNKYLNRLMANPQHLCFYCGKEKFDHQRSCPCKRMNACL